MDSEKKNKFIKDLLCHTIRTNIEVHKYIKSLNSNISLIESINSLKYDIIPFKIITEYLSISDEKEIDNLYDMLLDITNEEDIDRGVNEILEVYGV